MTIAPLSKETARFILSTLVLNDATSVVKELVDNGLDAGATSISIEISDNTLDVIQVKDNGHGIHVDDRLSLCKRGYTSKIRNFEDLENLGGSYLGFRGEALSSLAEVSDCVTVTTAVRGEVVGSVLKFGSSGQRLSSVSASHPVGTTVRVEKFLKSIPVRKQTALKGVTKTLAEIRKLLYSYAFARLHVRFAFKVLKGKNDKAYWSYAPDARREQLEGAAAKIVGKEVASMCKQHSIDSDGEDASDLERFHLDALLLNVERADLSKSSNIGQFMSIDSRPLNAERGIMKDIVKLYRSHLQHAAGPEIKIPSKPFLVLHMTCPRGAYDVNIEPAKDEIMFQDSHYILELLTRLFTQVYGQVPLKDVVPVQPPHHRDHVKPSRGFDLLLARKPETATSKIASRSAQIHKVSDDFDARAASPSNEVSLEEMTPPNSTVNKPFRNMYAIDDDDIPQTRRPPDHLQDADENEERGENSAHWIKNPFTTAALHCRIPSKKVFETDGQQTPTRDANARECTLRDDLGNSSPTVLGAGKSVDLSSTSPRPLPTPNPSPLTSAPYQNPGPPIRRWNRQEIQNDDDFIEQAVIEGGPSVERQQRLLQNWIQPHSPADFTRSFHSAKDILKLQNTPREAINGENCQDQNVGARQVSRNAMANPSGHLVPFRSPLKNPVSIENDACQLPSDRNRQFLNSGSVSSKPSSVQRIQNRNPELDQIMDFELRKMALNQRPKGNKIRSNPTELAQLQRASLEKLPLPSAHPIKVPDYSTASDSTRQVDDFESRFGADQRPALSSAPFISSPSKNADPHKSRYNAAIRHLRSDLSQPNTNDLTRSVGATEKLDIESSGERSQPPIRSHQILQPRTETTTIHRSDPRSNLITQNRAKNSATAISSNAKKVKTFRLPFETILPDELKCNVECIPVVPFPFIDQQPHPPKVSGSNLGPTSTRSHSEHLLLLLQSDVEKSSTHDPYILKGQNSFAHFNPFSKDTVKWEQTIENILQSKYHAQFQSATAVNDGDANASTDEENANTNVAPVKMKINLISAIKEHLNMIAINDRT